MALAFIFGDVGLGEWVVLMTVVLVVVGPRNLPSAARKLGAFTARLRRAAEGFKRQLLDLDSPASVSIPGAYASVGDESKALPNAEAGNGDHP